MLQQPSPALALSRHAIFLTFVFTLVFLSCIASSAAGQSQEQSSPSQPQLSEEAAISIAAGYDGVPLITNTHPELESHASYDGSGRNWEVTWSNPTNNRVLVKVVVDDAGGFVARTEIENEAYGDILPMLDKEEAISMARTQPKVSDWLSDKGEVEETAELDDSRVWTVKFSSDGNITAEVLVDDVTGKVNEIRIGPQVAWSMARGYKGAFGRIVNEPYIWLPLCFLFLAPYVRLKSPWRLFHLDLLVLLSFSVSHYFFNQGEIFKSVPLAYPPLLYIFARMLWVAARRDYAGVGGLKAEEVTERAPKLNFGPRPMLVLLAALLIFRIAINIADSNVVDVGYSGVIGAQLIEQRTSPYGNMPEDNGNGDTYGPLNYLLYVPFEKLLPWSGSWDDLPSAHAAAIFFDLVSVAGMYFAGRKLAARSKDARLLGLALAYGWAAYPYTTFVMSSNVNDSIAAAFIIWGFVFISAVPLGAVMLGFATQVKIFPAILAPLWASFPRAFRGWGKRALFISGFILALAAPMPVVFLGDGSLSVFIERSLKWQIGRESPFSIWGQHPESLATVQHIAQFILIGLAVIAYIWPARKSLLNLAAASAVLLVGFQLVQTHWFYLYISWFFPLAFAAMAAAAGRKEKQRIAENDGRFLVDSEIPREIPEPFG